MCVSLSRKMSYNEVCHPREYKLKNSYVNFHIFPPRYRASSFHSLCSVFFRSAFDVAKEELRLFRTFFYNVLLKTHLWTSFFLFSYNHNELVCTVHMPEYLCVL